MTLPTTDTRQPASRTFRYGSAAMADAGLLTKPLLDPITRRVDTFFSTLIAPNRTQEMLVEDLLGFGGLRTAMDLMRNRIFGGEQWDLASARERLMREALSIATDNVASGVLAYGMGQVLDKRFGSFSNHFPSFPTVELFQQLSRSAQTEAQFIQKLAKAVTRMQPEQTAQVAAVLQPLIQADNPVNVAAISRQIAQQLQQNHFDIRLNGQAFTLPELLQDTHVFLNQVKKTTPGLSAEGWGKVANGTLNATMRVKHIKLTSLAAGFLLTFAVPYWIRAMTKRLDKQDTYPGERGVIPPRFSATVSEPTGIATHKAFSTFSAANTTLAQHRRPNRAEKWFPYLTKSFNQGNPLPLLLSLIPLVFTVGLFDTVGRRFRNPLAPGFLKYLRNAYDFGKGFPFTTQQQMASMYAFLIASRLSSSRSGNEYRERMVDSFLGWSLWILGTPAIKRAISRWIDKTQGTQLVKPGDNLRVKQEILHLVKDGGKTLSRHVWIGALSTLATITLLGIVEPYLAILWTRHNVRKQQQATTQPSL
jgi:hypothetical protein